MGSLGKNIPHLSSTNCSKVISEKPFSHNLTPPSDEEVCMKILVINQAQRYQANATKF